MKNVTIFTDGGARGNPGPSGIGVVFYVDEKIILEIKEFIGDHTNNFAEYTALIKALTKAHEMGAENVECFLDSELVVKQLNGQYKIKEETLKPLAAKVLSMTNKFKSISFSHVRREKNKEADRLVNEAIDFALGIES
jgi:ribonuclease HI